MKKILALALALTFAMATSSLVLAQDGTGAPPKASKSHKKKHHKKHSKKVDTTASTNTSTDGSTVPAK
jgi:accessory colonization factor AcfC